MLLTSNLTAAERMIIWRRRQEMSQDRAAKHWGVSPWEYRLWENGERSSQPPVKLGRLEDHEACFIARRRAGMTRLEMAKAIGMSHYPITQMERGRTSPERLVEYWFKQ